MSTASIRRKSIGEGTLTWALGSLDRKLFRDLWRMKGQVLAIAAVLAGGIALFVLMLGTLQSLEQTRDAYYERYRFAHVFAQARRVPESVMAAIRNIAGVQTAESRIIVEVTLDIPDMTEPAVGRLISLPDGGQPTLNRLAVRSGQLPRSGAPLEIAVSEAFADAHGLVPGDTIAAIMNRQRRELTVSAIVLSPEYIYSLGPGALFPDDRTFGVFWIQRSTLAAAFDLDGAFNALSVSLLRGTSVDPVIAEIDDLLDPYGGLGAHSRADQTSNWFLENELDQLAVIIFVLPPLFLIISAFLLNVAVARLIEMEREQIGLLKAFGYSNFGVGWHYAKMALAMASVGIIVGCLLGAWMGRGMTELYAMYFRFPFLYYRPDLATFILAAVIGAGAAVFGTLTAVRRAVTLPPADAMRPPAPARFHKGVIDRLWIVTWLTQTGRIILRNIQRWPGRSALTVCGTAVSVAIIISSMFTLGAVDHIMDVQFNKAQRQDTTVTFVANRSDSALVEIRRLPGVMAAEPFHAVPARLSAGPNSERTSILGLESDARLFTLLDADLQVIAIPPTGLLMASTVAGQLGVNRGDTVTVEVLDGRRPTFNVPVTAIAEEYIGGSVAMDRAALARLLGDPQVMSGAHIALDPAQIDAFHRQVKETPIIAAVSSKTAMLDSFREQVAEVLVEAIVITGLFGGLIAFGVVYNSARIMLSERSRELASLRVLGFTRFEITYIMLGELAILTMIAMPLGCLLGFALAAMLSAAFETELYRIPLIVEPATFGLGIGVVGVAALLSGGIVAWRLRKLDLVAVLKARE